MRFARGVGQIGRYRGCQGNPKKQMINPNHRADRGVSARDDGPGRKRYGNGERA